MCVRQLSSLLNRIFESTKDSIDNFRFTRKFDERRSSCSDFCKENVKYILSQISQISIVFVGVVLIYKCGKPKEIVVRVPDPKFTILDPHYNVSIPPKDIYNELFAVKNFEFLINPPTCNNYDAGILLLIIISTDPSHYQRRSIIRETWGESEESIKLIFLIGLTSDDAINAEVQNEHVAFGDIVKGNFVDAYRNMSYKHAMGLKWVRHHCPMAKYILKTDDDMLIHTPALKKFLVKELSPWGTRDLIACNVVYGGPVLRDFKAWARWAVSKEEFPADVYPDYCSGAVILYSQDVVQRLIAASSQIAYFWIDDVFISGIVAEKAGVPRTAVGSLMLNWPKTDLIFEKGLDIVGPFLFGPININAGQTVKLWKMILKSLS